mmetsp:Transcript_40073/g.93018  ORF Transcript_40073/g.93018 Transcript_40073/m.93018 type:complete len:170 (+) Transcript_40073:74-583(+)|eukprot:CAMPEP_0171067234 /NCGR_PEP_ID=MMETSP0766_2-20121228/7882_1 /TAXON_ID=439317 /ORGANISM="Gambierdiscus australes, Strain CAWD 149" /LENGTH=169 /DNA_ID=CAMNT_0011523459 /DNA_START=74 /DNA_END=583 /DNA_ORIENTATION=+
MRAASLAAIGLTLAFAERSSTESTILGVLEAERIAQGGDEPGDSCTLCCDCTGGPLGCYRNKCRFKAGQPYRHAEKSKAGAKYCQVPNREKDGVCRFSEFNEACTDDEDCGPKGLSCGLIVKKCLKSCRNLSPKSCPECKVDSECSNKGDDGGRCTRDDDRGTDVCKGP